MKAKSKSKSKRKPTRGKPRTYARGAIEINPRGFGFVKTSSGEFFIPRSKIGGAFDGDVVEVARTNKESKKSFRERKEEQALGHRQEARVVRVIERAHECVVGRYDVADPFGIVVPLDPRIPYDIFTKHSKKEHIPDGSIVRVRIIEFPTQKSSAFGVVEEVLGASDDTEVLIEQVIAQHKLKTIFPDTVQAEAKGIDVGVAAALRDGYKDIRSRFVFTIDPADARDFDDALSLDVADGHPANQGACWRVGVHIADVSRYVEYGSSLDAEAQERATSVYLPDRVIPMLPEELSNGVCSLVPHEDRLSMTVDIYLTDTFELVDYDIYPAVIQSKARLTYDQALHLLEGKEVNLAGSEDVVESIQTRLITLDALAYARKKLRKRQGGLEFSTKEARVILSSTGVVEGISVREKSRSTELIEEAMVFANEIVATYLEQNEYPCAYRDHEPPPADAITGLVPVLQEFCWFTSDMSRRLSVADPYAIQQILAACKGRREENLVSSLLLRAMSRAVYSMINLGHYGLGLDCYCHFTSPIRRYPDLMVHRMVRLAYASNQATAAKRKEGMKLACDHCSSMERVAEAASLAANKALTCIYMEQFIGKTFLATISGVMGYGLYVTLDDCTEGLIPVRYLGDEYFVLDPVRLTLKGSDTSKEYRLGDVIEVRLLNTEPLLHRITFTLA